MESGRGRLRMRAWFLERIRSGKLAAGTELAGTAVLARRFGLSLMSAQRTLSELAKEGYLERRPGRRTVVCGARRPVAGDTVGVMLPQMGLPLTAQTSPNHFRFVQGILSALETEGWNMMVLGGMGEAPSAEALRARDLCGLICVQPLLRQLEWLESIRAGGLPVVVVNARPPELYAGFAQVARDYAGGGRLAYEEFRRRGCRRPAFATPTFVQWEKPQLQLLRGFALAAREDGVSVPVIELFLKTPSSSEVAACVPELLRRLAPYDAVLCAHGTVAEAIHAADPGLALIGLAMQGKSPDYPHFLGAPEEEGRAAVDVLVEALRKGGAPRRVQPMKRQGGWS